MSIGVTLVLKEWNGKEGKCENGHVVKINSTGYGLCCKCLNDIDAYHTLYVAPKDTEIKNEYILFK